MSATPQPQERCDMDQAMPRLWIFIMGGAGIGLMVYGALTTWG